MRRRTNDRGANLVEFAFLAPLLIALVLGIVDFAWILSTHQDVRHGTREAARLAAVNTDTAPNMASLVCNAMNFSTGSTVTFSRAGSSIGSTGTAMVSSPVTSLTGFSSLPFMGSIYPTTFTESVDFRLEQPATWITPGGGSCP